MIRIKKETNDLFCREPGYRYELIYTPKSASCGEMKTVYLCDEADAIALAKLFRKFGHRVSLFCDEVLEFNFKTEEFDWLY